MVPKWDNEGGRAVSADRQGKVWSLSWRLAWIGVPLLAGLILVAILPSNISAPKALLALLILPVPAIFSFVRGLDRYEPKGLSAAIWSLTCAASAALTGGLNGPFAALCLAPLAASIAPSILNQRRVAQGAVAALVAVIATAFIQAAGLTRPPPPAAISAAMGALAGIGLALTLAAGLIRNQRMVSAEQRQQVRRAVYVQSLMECQPNLVMALSPDGRARAVFGSPPPGVLEVTLLNIGLEGIAQLSDRPLVRAALNASALHGESVAFFAPEMAPDRTIALSLRHKSPDLIIAVLRDATADRAREVQLEEARADAESRAAGRSRFLANMSHELRTPLNAIMGFSDMIRQRMFGPVSDRYGEYAQLIHESGGHLLDLIKDLLDMSKIEAERFELHREDFDSREAITAALRLMRVQADSAEIKLRGVLPPRALEIDADRRVLKQIVLNLVSNALKFTPKGGSVTVAIHGVGSMFELIVADTGVGIAQEDLARLGRPYEQAGDVHGRSRGTGLGLSLVRGLAELHGGEMILESRQGAGTSVTVRMPVISKPILTPMPAANQPPPELGGNVVAFSSPRLTNGE